MTYPDPAPKEAQPIKGPGLHAGQVQAVVTFRLQQAPDDQWIRRIYRACLDSSPEVIDGSFTIGLRIIGAGGEKGEDEGRWDQLTLTEDVPVARTLRDTDTVDPGELL